MKKLNQSTQKKVNLIYLLIWQGRIPAAASSMILYRTAYGNGLPLIKMPPN